MRNAWLVLGVLGGFGCGDKGDPLIAQAQAFQRQVCACTTSACLDQAKEAIDAWQADQVKALDEASGVAARNNPIEEARYARDVCAQFLNAAFTLDRVRPTLCACADASCARPHVEMGRLISDALRTKELGSPQADRYRAAQVAYDECSDRWSDMLDGSGGGDEGGGGEGGGGDEGGGGEGE